MAAAPGVVTLHSFCIFNRQLGSSEEDATLQERAEKILYHFPNDEDVKEKVRLVETVESFVDLGRMLGLSKDGIHSIFLSDVRYGVLEVEPSTYMCIGISSSGPETRLPNDSTAGPQSGIASMLYRTITGGGANDDASKNSAPPSVEALRAVLEQTYDALVFLSGPFSRRMAQGGESLGRLRLFLRKAVRWCLSSVCLHTLHCGALHAMTGVEHFPLEKHEFLIVQSFAESFTLKFAIPSGRIYERKLMVIHGGMLAWSSLTPREGRRVMRLLSTLGALDGAEGDSSRFIELGEYHQQLLDGASTALGNFATIGHEGSRTIAPLIFPLQKLDSHEDSPQPAVRMVALKRGKTVVVFFLKVDIELQQAVDVQPSLDVETFQRVKNEETAVAGLLRKVQSGLGPALEQLCSLLEDRAKGLKEEQALREAKSSRSDPMFIYFNAVNLVIKASPRYLKSARIIDSYKLAYSEIPSEVMCALDLVRSSMVRSTEDDGYTAVVAGTSCIVGWRSGGRELYCFEPLAKVIGSYYYSGSGDPYLALDKLQQRLEEIVASKFANVMLV